MLKEISHGSHSLNLFIYLSILMGTCHIINVEGEKTCKLRQTTVYRVTWYCAWFCNTKVTDGRAHASLVCIPLVERTGMFETSIDLAISPNINLGLGCRRGLEELWSLLIRLIALINSYFPLSCLCISVVSSQHLNLEILFSDSKAPDTAMVDDCVC